MLFYDRRRLFFACQLTRLLEFLSLVYFLCYFTHYWFPLSSRQTEAKQSPLAVDKWHRKAANLSFCSRNVYIFKFQSTYRFVDRSPHLCSAVLKHSGMSVKICNNSVRREICVSKTFFGDDKHTIGSFVQSVSFVCRCCFYFRLFIGKINSLWNLCWPQVCHTATFPAARTRSTISGLPLFGISRK